MVDVEKPQEEMNNQTNGTPEEAQASEVTEPEVAAEVEPEVKEEVKEEPKAKPQAVDMGDFIEEDEYSPEEYQNFVDLYERTMRDITEGQIVEGRVLAVTQKDVLVDIGFKSEGTIPIDEFEDPENIETGSIIEVFLDKMEDTDGQLILSKKKADFVRMWDKVLKAHESGETIEGRCVRRIKGGIVVDLAGVDAFLPGSQIDVKPIRDFDALIGQTYTFKIVKVNQLRKNIVVSRRVLLEESMAEERSKVLVDLEKGQKRKGTVKNITDFGVFVDLGGVDGLLHINDLSWGRINHPSEVVKLDEEIEVVILDFNDAKDRISLGLKQLQAHPWEGVEEKYGEGKVVKGKVVSIADYGAFVELEKGVEGLIHVSEMSWTRHIVHPSKVVNVGENVEVKVLNVDKERKRISLGLKQLTPDPWEGIQEKYPIGAKFKGRVRNMTNFGVFVEMEEGIDGLIHISDLSWTKKIKHPSEILKKSEEIEVVVLDVDRTERRLSLGYKQLDDDPWPAFEEAYKLGSQTTGKVIRFIEKGLIVELPLGVEGFVPLSQMEEANMSKVSQSIKEGEDIELIVIEFDRENKRIVLSRKKVGEAVEQQQKDEEKAEVDAYMNREEEATTLGDVAGDLANAVKEDANVETKEEAPVEDSDAAAEEEKKDDSEEEKAE